MDWLVERKSRIHGQAGSWTSNLPVSLTMNDADLLALQGLSGLRKCNIAPSTPKSSGHSQYVTAFDRSTSKKEIL